MIRLPIPADRAVVGSVAWDGADERLDVLVSRLLDRYPTRAAARKACERGELVVNGEISESGRWVRAGDTLAWLEPTTRPAPTLQRRFPVLFEDDHLAVVLKPSGLPTSGAHATTVERALPANLARSGEPDALDAPRCVHRLDSPTSGVLVVAKTRSAHAALGQAFEQRRVTKRYRAVAAGRLEGEGRCEEPLDGKEAVSVWRAVEHTRSLRTEWLTTLDLWPETGRTHQLRRHLAGLGHPILGDTTYAGPTLVGKGLFLFAAAITLPHPASGEALLVEAPEPPKFAGHRAREARRFGARAGA